MPDKYLCRSKFALLEGVLAEAFAGEGEVGHVGGDGAAEVFVDVEFGEVLSEHEAVSAEASEEAHRGVDDVARLGVAASPYGVEADVAQAGDPLGEDFGDDFEELAAVVLDVLSGLVGVGVGAGAADDLAGVGELLAVDGGEAAVVAAVDDHVERLAGGAEHGEAACDEGLVLDGVEAGVDAEHVGEFLGAPAHGVDEVVAEELDVVPVVGADECGDLVATALHLEEFAVFVEGAAGGDAEGADIVDDAPRGGLPAVAGDEGVGVGGGAVVPEGGYFGSEVAAVDHVGVAPGARGVEGAVGGVVVDEVDVARGAIVDVAVLLHLAEDFVAVLRDVGDVGVGEGRATTADVAPGGAAVVVDHDGVEACLGEVAEEGAAGDAAAGDEDFSFDGFEF